MIAIVDYGMGNVTSARMALEHVGAEVELTDDPARIAAADGVVLPGVGAFPRAMEAVRARGLDELVRERVGAGVPVIGLCLGMQLLFESSDEHEGEQGLGLLGGHVARLDTRGLKLPHIGWNMVRWTRESPLVDGLGAQAAFYHVHSFAPVPEDESIVLGRGDYGGGFVSFVEKDHVFGAQCHPEKSSSNGLRVLANFERVCSGVAAA